MACSDLIPRSVSVISDVVKSGSCLLDIIYGTKSFWPSLMDDKTKHAPFAMGYGCISIAAYCNRSASRMFPPYFAVSASVNFSIGRQSAWSNSSVWWTSVITKIQNEAPAVNRFYCFDNDMTRG